MLKKRELQVQIQELKNQVVEQLQDLEQLDLR